MEPTVGQIEFFPYTFSPRGWTLCNGSTLPISENTMLFALFGTIYGGDGRTTVGLPRLSGRIPKIYGHGAGLTNVPIGQIAGTTESVTLTSANTPAHTHTIQVGKEGLGAGPTTTAAGSYLGNAADNMYRTSGDNSASLNTGSVSSVGSSAPLSIMNPYLGLRPCVAIVGIFPAQP